MTLMTDQIKSSTKVEIFQDFFKVPFYNYLVVILIGNGVLSWILKNTILWIFSESPPNLGRFHYEFTLTPAGGVGFAVGHGVGRVS